jgi:hypothetical protein
MKTDDLIAALSRQTPPVMPHVPERRLGLAALAALLGSALVVLVFFGPRVDLASVPAASVLKALFGLATAAAATPLALQSARPAGQLNRAAAPLVLFVLTSAVAAGVVVALAPAGGRVAAFLPGFPPCLMHVPLAAIPGAVVVFLVFRSLAPTRLAHAGAAAGALAGGIAVITYAMHCPIDSMGYVLAWYPLAVLICAGVGALVGPRLLRW